LGSAKLCLRYQRELLVNKKTKEANKFATPRCTKKDGDSCAILSQLESKDKKKNFKYLKQACDLKSGYGCGLLAKYYFQDKKPDLEKKTLTKACELNDGYGCFGLGELAYGKKDFPEAERLLKKGCDNGYGSSCFEVYSMKINVKPALTEAQRLKTIEEYLFAGCVGEDVLSCQQVADYFRITGNYEESLNYSMPWCSKRYPQLCLTASYAAWPLRNYPILKQVNEIACDANFGVACGTLGSVLINMGNRAEGFKRLEKGCGLNDWSACAVRAQADADGKIEDRIKWVNKSLEFADADCKKGLQEACKFLPTIDALKGSLNKGGRSIASEPQKK
jgi:hypothetical protein